MMSSWKYSHKNLSRASCTDLIFGSKIVSLWSHIIIYMKVNRHPKMIPNKVTSEGIFYCKLFTVKNWRESNATQLEINWKSPIDRWKFPITLTKRFIIETSGIIKELNIHAFQITDVKDVKQLSRYSSFCCFWLCLFFVLLLMKSR